MAITSWAWIALVTSTPITPDRYGSSEKYSKLRPAIGGAVQAHPGPSRTCWPSVAVSEPMMSPYARASSGSKPAASPMVIGSEVAGGLGVPSPIPTPTGPLVIRNRGMPELVDRRHVPFDLDLGGECVQVAARSAPGR